MASIALPVVSFVSCPLCNQRDSESCHICHGSDVVSVDRVSEIVEQTLAACEHSRESAPSWIWESGEYIFEFTAFIVADDRSVTFFDPASSEMPSSQPKSAKRSVVSVIWLALANVASAFAGKRVAA
jgi:hypothetical protein